MIIIILCGFLGEEFIIKVVDKDLYFGMYGGFVCNLIVVFVKIIVGLYDENGCVMVSGFYDGVLELIDEIKV